MLRKLEAMLDPTERRALTLSVFAASCLCFAPGQIVSGAFLLLVSFVLWRWDQKLLRREEAAEQASTDTNVS
jgi:prepilin signal peptidase PulO-like enzyme (type II secretory pathway)